MVYVYVLIILSGIIIVSEYFINRKREFLSEYDAKVTQLFDMAYSFGDKYDSEDLHDYILKIIGMVTLSQTKRVYDDTVISGLKHPEFDEYEYFLKLALETNQLKRKCFGGIGVNW